MTGWAVKLKTFARDKPRRWRDRPWAFVTGFAAGLLVYELLQRLLLG